jgi:glycine oxidase
VIGAGIMGSAIAWGLARGGRRVVLLDRGEPGGEASSAAAGLLQPEAGREAGPQLLALWLHSLARYPDFVAAVREATQSAFDFRICGRLVVALSEAEEEELRRRAAAQDAAGIPYQWVAAAEVRALEPAVTPAARAALHYPQHGLVDNARLTAALATAATRNGVQVHPYEPALEIAIHGGRVVGVGTPRGRYAADVVVNCAGAWAATFAPTGGRVPSGPTSIDGPTHGPIVRPSKGEILSLQTPARPIERVISIASGSVSARSDGRVIVGATVREAGFDKMLTADGVARMLDAAFTAVPSLRAARFQDAWTGLRPKTPDEEPIIGPDPVPGLFWATGHYKMGILSAPATAEVVVALVEGRQPPVPVDRLGPGRLQAVANVGVDT